MSFGFENPNIQASLIEGRDDKKRAIIGVEVELSNGQYVEQSSTHSVVKLSFEDAEELNRSLSIAIENAKKYNQENGVVIVSNVTHTD